MNKIPTFLQLINDINTPIELKELIERSKTTPQTLLYHPENEVYNHIEIVYNYCLQTNDIDLVLSAFFHDLGKVTTTFKHPTKVGCYPAYGHELVSAELVKKYRKWIVQNGADFNNVYYIVYNHMRIHVFNEMRKSKQFELSQHPAFNKLKLFNEFDSMNKLKNNG